MEKSRLGRAFLIFAATVSLFVAGCEKKPTVQREPAAPIAGMSEGKGFRTVGGFNRIPGKIMVRDYFWYGCPHCYNLHKEMKRWSSTVDPRQVVFVHVPVSLGSPKWEIGARFHLALVKQHLSEAEHEMVFDAIHVEKLNSADKEALIAWAGTKGWNADKLRADWDSQEVNDNLKRIQDEAQVLQLPGTPGVLIDGVYVLDANVTGLPQVISEKTHAVLTELTSKMPKPKGETFVPQAKQAVTAPQTGVVVGSERIVGPAVPDNSVPPSLKK